MGLGRAVRLRRVALVALLALLAAADPAAPQDALVLSGGGSRGIAHAGALLELEAHGYDPELVVGASMGAVIGSLYAAGYTPPEIVAIVEAVDWHQIFAPRVAIVGPEQEPRYPVLRVNRFPDGPFSFRHIVPDWRINRLLVRTLYPPLAAARGDFDRLPRRFRAVAADLGDLELVAPAEGNLPLLVRASLSAPAFFAPVRWQDRWLVDGGARDYLPVSLARDLGADRVVAVDVVRPPDTLTSLGAGDVAQRALRLLLQQARADAPARPDLLILPDLPPDLSAAIFPADPAPLIRAGARGAAHALAAAPAPAGAASPPRRRPAPAPPAIDRLQVDGPPPLDHLARRVFEPLLRRYDTATVLTLVDRLYATGLVDGVWPVLVEEAGEVVLRVRIDPAGEAIIDGALAYDSDQGARGWARVATLLAPGGWPSTLSASGSLSRDRGWASAGFSVPAPVRPDLRLRLAAQVQRTRVRSRTDDVDVWRAGGWIGGDWRHPGSQLLLAGRVTAEHVDITDGGGFAWGPVVRVQRLDPMVRAAGLAPRLAGELRLGAVEYRRVEAGGSLPIQLGPLTVAPLVHGALTDGAPPPDALAGLGDGRLIPAVEPEVGRGRSRFIGGVDLALALPYESTLRLRTRTGVARDVGAAGDRVQRTGSGLSVLWWTPFGQVEMGVEAELEGNTRFLLQLGPDW